VPLCPSPLPFFIEPKRGLRVGSLRVWTSPRWTRALPRPADRGLHTRNALCQVPNVPNGPSSPLSVFSGLGFAPSRGPGLPRRTCSEALRRGIFRGPGHCCGQVLAVRLHRKLQLGPGRGATPTTPTRLLHFKALTRSWPPCPGAWHLAASLRRAQSSQFSALSPPGLRPAPFGTLAEALPDHLLHAELSFCLQARSQN